MAIVKYNRPKQSESAAVAAVSFESATAEIIARRHPGKERAVLYVLTALLVSIFAFISVVKLDRIVNAPGRIIPTGGAVTVQPLDKAIINRILVSVGDTVKKGQVLAICDPTFVKADLAAMREKVASLDAQKRRMEAEEASRPFKSAGSKPHDAFQESV